MPLDKETLEYLSQLMTAAQEVPDSDRKFMLVPNSMKTVSLETYQNNPDDFTARFSTHLISAFLDYANFAKSENTTAIFIDVDDLSANAIFDMGDIVVPGWGNHCATLKLRRTALFVNLLMIMENNIKLSQRDLFDFLLDWPDNLVCMVNDTTLPTADVIQRLRKITVGATASKQSHEGDFARSRTAFEEIEVSAEGGPLPSTLVATLQPYYGLGEYTMKFRIGYLDNDDEPLFRLHPVEFEALKEQIASDFAQVLQQSLPDTENYIGTMKYR